MCGREKDTVMCVRLELMHDQLNTILSLSLSLLKYQNSLGPLLTISRENRSQVACSSSSSSSNKKGGEERKKKMWKQKEASTLSSLLLFPLPSFAPKASHPPHPGTQGRYYSRRPHEIPTGCLKDSYRCISVKHHLVS